MEWLSVRIRVTRFAVEEQAGHRLLRTNSFDLDAFDRAQGVGVGQGAIIHIVSPEEPGQAGGSSNALNFEAAVGWLEEMDLGGGRGQPGPAKHVSRMEGRRRRKIARRLVAEGRWPGGRRRQRRQPDKENCGNGPNGPMPDGKRSCPGFRKLKDRITHVASALPAS